MRTDRYKLFCVLMETPDFGLRMSVKVWPTEAEAVSAAYELGKAHKAKTWVMGFPRPADAAANDEAAR